MNELEFIAILSSIVLQSSPLIIAVCGETITERVGIVNLSLDGSMLMAAMTGFVIAFLTNNLLLGFLAAAGVGAIFAFIIAFGSIRLGKSQVAIGFVLTLLGADLSAFLGQNYTGESGPSLTRFGIRYLEDIPFFGPVLFDQDLMVYFAFILIVVTWWFLFRTQPGLHLRSVGERPEAAFARGVHVNRIRYLYTLIGGALIGIAGASYSLSVKIGWSDGHTRGLGWIALAIVIFGGWSPIRGAIGAILFGAAKWWATNLQANPDNVISPVLLNAMPLLLMIIVLVVVGSKITERTISYLPLGWQRPLRNLLRVDPPLALGKTFGDN